MKKDNSDDILFDACTVDVESTTTGASIPPAAEASTSIPASDISFTKDTIGQQGKYSLFLLDLRQGLDSDQFTVLKELNLGKRAKGDAVLFTICPSNLLTECFHLFKKWHFAYNSCGTLPSSESENDYFSEVCVFLLVATKGTLIPVAKKDKLTSTISSFGPTNLEVLFPNINSKMTIFWPTDEPGWQGLSFF